MMAIGYGLWTCAMAHPAGARLAPAAYATPLLSTVSLLATGQQLSPLGLLGCALIVLCAAGVIRDALPRRHPPNAPRHDQPTITERRRQVRRVHRSL